MTGRLRWLLAAAFAALYFLIPSPDSPEGRRYLALLKVRSWLMDGDSPYSGIAAARDGVLGPMVVRLQASPPLEDPQQLTDEQDRYSKSSMEWVAGRAADGGNERFDARAEAMHLEIVIGDYGVQATLRHSALANPAELPEPKRAFPARASLLPPFLAIILAILTGKVIPALLLGCLAGGVVFVSAKGFEITSLFTGPVHYVDAILIDTVLASGFNMRVTAFVICLFMAVGVMARSGGIQGMVAWISRFARGPISTQLCSWVIGLLIFFDDYSNCIITGTTMRPLTDRNRVSREKLAYIVDSTAAPVAGISIFSTWVAYEVSQFRGQLPLVTKADGVPYSADEGFSVFVQTLPFRFYCIFTIAMVLLTIVLRRDWGPMLTAERRARHEGKPVADDALPMVSKSMEELEAPDGAPLRGINAFLPVLVLVLATIGLIVNQGLGKAYDAAWVWQGPEGLSAFERVQWILGQAETEKALLMASIVALVLAAALALGQRILTVAQVAVSALRSAHSLIFAVIILLLAWSIGGTCGELGTNFFLTAAFRDVMDATVLPIVLFLLAGLVAFCTGTSYGTMAILLPNVVVLAHSIGSEAAIGGPALMVLTIGAVLEGSIFGDHCSPISDTTVLSSVGSGSDHLHHVQTQAPYAVLTMAVAVVCGYLPMVLLGPGWWPLAWGMGFAAIGGWLWLCGRDPEADVTPAL